MLIIGIRNDFFALEPLWILLKPEFQVHSYSKIIYIIIHIQAYTQFSHIQAHTVITHIIELLLYIIISCSCIMHIKFSCSHNFNIYLQQVIQQKLAGGGEALDHPWRTTSSKSEHP
jgi:hypothetical protein